MPGRLPMKSDFPSSLELSITPPPSSQPPTNVLVLLHGLGDTNEPFTKLGQQLSLPETVCISVQAPNPLPFFLSGFNWSDDLVIDQNTHKLDGDVGFKVSTRLILDSVICEGLIGQCGYKAREIIVFGYGQGAMAGLQAAAELEGDELGGVISIGGVLPLSLPLKALERKSKTPVLVCKGSRGSAVSDSAITRLKDAFEFLQLQQWNEYGDKMPRNREEMLPIMQFFARRLRSTRGVPAGGVELT
ncbi:phospholipase/Carboxylesteras-like protein [Lindgomyces ingoldianus]|uniref:Phospholipase/Carboxylesteras-like protein n=1 Tax=Lindgomyces ingoldianus TaxID=673940 RepID=A0ACB6QEV6_9PLEO|nr:phospholipase/Carboxylesteras-like protein [Lindgomyces ingoldianus]KAF2465143.1 phospholipase/Carboxylesteras-like protein [Lindgomyces ingoldianus]